MRIYTTLLAGQCECCERRGLIWRLPARPAVLACTAAHAQTAADRAMIEARTHEALKETNR